MDSVALAIAAGGAAAGFAGIARELLRALHPGTGTESFLTVDEFLLKSVDGELRQHTGKTVEIVLRKIPELRYQSTISLLSGRLVFSARDISGTEFVVKTVLGTYQRERAQAALFNEAMILGYLKGRRAPRLVRVATTDDGLPFVVRTMLPGSSLDRVLFDRADRADPPTLSEVHAILGSVSEAVSALHQQNVVHGDIKPANILATWAKKRGHESLYPSSDVILLDYEAASIVSPASTLGLHSVSRGTPFFMAPERYALTRMSRSSDVYSLSALASLLLTGRPAWPGAAAGQRITSTKLREAIRSGLSVELRHRPQSVDEWYRWIDTGLREMIAELGDTARVNWPLDSDQLKTEIAEQALTISFSPRANRRFSRVRGQIDSATLDSLVSSEVSELDERTRHLAEAVWFDDIPLPEAASSFDLSPAEAEERLVTFVARLNDAVRAKSLERDRLLDSKT